MFLRIFLILFLSVFSLSASEIENKLDKEVLEKILQKSPRNVPEILEYVDTCCLNVDKMIGAMQSVPIEKMTFDNTIKAWNKIGEIYFEGIAFLKDIEAVTCDAMIIESAKVGCEKLYFSLSELLKNEPLLEKIVAFIETQVVEGNLSPSEKYYFLAFLKERNQLEDESLRERISNLEGLLEESNAFTACRGNCAPKKGDYEKFTVLNWNVCFLPGFLSMTYGGMLPWEYRLEKVVEFIKKSDADVVCLQEVFQEESAVKLYEALKNDYAYFYINIAPKNFGFKPDGISLGSGLFVASKYEIPEASWSKYKETWIENITRGFFDFEIVNGEAKARVLTTHLDASLAIGSAENFRALQLKQILSHLEEKSAESDEPVIICGDLNVYWGCSEPAEGIMKKFFYDPYNKETECPFTYCDFTGYWWPEYVMNEGRKKFEPKLCILDYALLLKAVPSGESVGHNYVAETTVLQANFPENPEGALSDHHALLTTYFWKPKN